MSCHCATSGIEAVRGPLRRAAKCVAWFLPGATLVLMPKCPMCVAAYVTLWTGVGLSFHAASFLRWTLLILSTVALLYLAAKRFVRRNAIFNHLTKENKQCSSKS